MNVFLDLDGTLTDPACGITRCLEHALHALGYRCPPQSELECYIGPPLRDCFGELLPQASFETIDRAIALYRQRFDRVGLFENVLYPHAAEFLACLRRDGHRLRLVTSKPHVYAERILDHFKVARCFAGVHGAELSGAKGDKATLVGMALDASESSPEDACMVGDRSHDIIGARAHGVATIGVLWGYGSEVELRAAGADSLACTMTDVRARLRLLGG